MVDKRVLLKLLVLLSAIANTPSAIPAQEPNQATRTGPSTTSCAITQPIRAEPPRDPDADRFGFGPWYINSDQTIWAGWNVGEWVAGGTGNKVMWIRPKGTQLRIAGRRLDAAAAPLKAAIPCCYPTGFQPSWLSFPSPGCWEVTGKSGASTLTFTTIIK